MLRHAILKRPAALICLWLVSSAGSFVFGQSNPPTTPSATNVVVEIENRVEVLRAGARVWDLSTTNQVLYPGDQLRTGERSRAVLRLSNLTLMRVGELSTLQIPEPEATGGAHLNILKGVYYFFHRDKPGRFQIHTPTVSAVVRGTEFNIEVTDESTRLTLLDGAVVATNAFGSVSLTNGESVVAERAKPVVKTAVINAVNVVQWCLYYPAVLDLAELPFTAQENAALAGSLAAYRRGNLLLALANYPANREPTSLSQRLYLAALLLSVGQAEKADASIASVLTDVPPGANEDVARRLGGALRRMIMATKLQTAASNPKPATATEWLAESYYRQSQSHLEAALDAARQATERAPGFGFAWARLAELEFSFGRIPESARALDRALELMPENAEGWALRGFLFAARHQMTDAMHSFDTAIAMDGALGNAWLGRGLCRIRRGQLSDGLWDLQVAVTLEPQRSLFRSYLAKANSEVWDDQNARREIQLASRLDPYDPTPWLYSALIAARENRINQAVRDLEKSQALNDNRSVYRSRLLLDQDRAVRSANLAAVYRDAGMAELSLREASKAVTADYANYSAHLFLANSYDLIRDPRLIDLRLETAAVSEYLIANLLAPAGAGTLSRTISEQDYVRLFDRNRLHLASTTEYLSGGDWTQNGSFYGKSGSTAFSLESAYRAENGQRVNDDLEQLNLSLSLKQQVTAQDSLYFQTVYFDAESGDLTRYYDPAAANTRLRVQETQEPILLAGYHHEWTPNIHTLVLASRLTDSFDVQNPMQPVLLLGKDASNQVVLIARPRLPIAPLSYSSEAEIYSAELQQVVEADEQTFVAGGRYQTGQFETKSRLGASAPTLVGNQSTTLSVPFATAPLDQTISSDFQRLGLYGYYTWRPWEPLAVTAGLAYDHLRFPRNFRQPPLSSQSEENDQLSPKAGLVWTPSDKTTIRASYTRSLGGVSLDQSFRLEPTEVGGFNQAFRSAIPESSVGSLASASFETAAIGLDQRLPSGTYVGLEANVLYSDAVQTVGAFDLATGFPFAITPSGTEEDLNYRERSIIANLNQLLGDAWSIGARYRLSDADLTVRYPNIPLSVSSGAEVKPNAVLHQADLYGLFNHPSGFFAGADALWTMQSNRGYSPDLPGDEFWHFNAFVGYRFAQRRAEIRLGVLNITDQDYRLNPLNLVGNLRRERTLVVSAKFVF